jgi:hypothetical protein
VGSDLLDLAVKYGYKPRGTHEVWGWRSTSPMFRKMIAELLIDKLCASPLDKLGMLEKNVEERRKFITEFCNRLYLPKSLHPSLEQFIEDCIAYYLSKQKVNSVWGYSCRNMMQNTTCIVFDGKELEDKLSTIHSTHTISAFQPIGNRRILLRLKPNKPAMNCRGNVFIGTVTTQKGQLELVKSLLKIDEQVLYCDTDSAIYFTTPLYPNRLPLGHFVGEWANELNSFDKELQFLTGDNTARCIISALLILAPKAYAKRIEAQLAHYQKFMPPIDECKLKVNLIITVFIYQT